MKSKTIIRLAMISLFAASFGAGCLGPEADITSDSQGVETDSIVAGGQSIGEGSDAFRVAPSLEVTWSCTLEEFTQAGLHMAANHPGCVMAGCNYNSSTGYIVYGYQC
jgi:hypothetical protein